MAEEPLAEKDAEEEKQIPPKSEASSTQKLSHKQWRAKLRREKRKIRRQEIAKVVASTEQKEFENEADSEEERLREQRDEAERAYLNRLWLEREQKAMQEWKWKKEQEERDQLKREEQERKIKEEWEERQKKEQEENEEQERKNKEKKSKQDDLLRQATANENKEGDGPWHNPIVTTMPGRERDKCPFFAKTGACRFGDRCSRVHPQPESSTVLLFRGMYSHFELQQGLHDEYDTDLILEYEDSELYQNFRDFYEDIVPEFKAIGKVVQVKVCCNYEPHLRGNVYVQFRREEDTASALMKFNGRFYAGKQLSCEFVDIVNWKSAVCGLFGSGRCPKGKNCNFLHVFKNPNNEFWDADRRQFNRSRSRSPYQNRSYRRYSRSRTHRSRSRSRSRRHSKSRSRSRSRDRYYSSKSRRRRRSRTRSYSRSRSRSNSRERRQERKKSKDYDSKLKTKDYSSRSDSSRRYSYSRSDSKPREDYSRSESKPKDQRSRSENKSQDSVSKIDEINGTESSNGSKHYRVKYTEEAIEKGLSEILAMSKNGAEKHESDKYDREDSDHSNSPVSCKHKKHKSHKHKKHKRSSRD